MRSADSYGESLFTTVKLEDVVPAKHPLRPIRAWVHDALAKMDRKFSAVCEADIKGGRPSIAPERPMCAMLLQVLYSVRRDAQFVEQIQYNLLFRWFVGPAIEEPLWNHSVCSKNRDRRPHHRLAFNDLAIEFSCPDRLRRRLQASRAPASSRMTSALR